MAREPMISVLSYSFRGLLAEGKMDVFGYLEACKYRYGLDVADIWNGFLPTLDEDYLKKVKDALDEREMVLADLAVDGAHIWEADPAVREEHHEKALAALKAGEILGARFVRIDAGGSGMRAETWSDEEFDHIVMRYKEYAQWAYDHGFKAGTESHWGPEGWWKNMKKLYPAVGHPGFGVSYHFGGWRGTDEEKAEAEKVAAPWVTHTHIPWNYTENPETLTKTMGILRAAGYQGSYSAEHHSAKNEYTEVAVQLARIRDVIDRWRLEEA